MPWSAKGVFLVKSKRGFTILELLGVMAIIAILASMLFVAARYVTSSAKKNTTRTMLQNLKAFTTEREAALGATRVRQDIDGIFTTAGAGASDAATIGLVDKGFNAQRYPVATNAVGATQAVITLLRASPPNAAVLTNLPSKQFLESATNPLVATQPSVLMDGWDYPIIAVPSTGLANVKLNGVAQPNPIRSPDGKPFFASPGPDGSFEKGDDNVYSFEN